MNADTWKLAKGVLELAAFAAFRFGVTEVSPDPTTTSLVFWSGLLRLVAYERWVQRMMKRWA